MRPGFSPSEFVFSIISSFSSPDLDYSEAFGDSAECDTHVAQHGHTGGPGAACLIALFGSDAHGAMPCSSSMHSLFVAGEGMG